MGHIERQENKEKRQDANKEEVVFVLRVRAGEAGWWGQVRRLDTDSARSVASLPDLFALLERDWNIAMALSRT